MRRFKALLIAAGLAAAPASAAAAPSSHHLGVYVMSLTPELRTHFHASSDRGVMVAKVEPLSPAALAGLQPGDVVTEARGKPIKTGDDLVAAIADLPGNMAIDLQVIRDGKQLNVTAKLGTDPLSWLEDLFRPLRETAHTLTAEL